MGVKCATLLAEHKADSSFIINQIKEMKAYLNVIWLGSKFRSEVRRLYDLYVNGKINKRFILLHWQPSDVINGRFKYEPIEMPPCDKFDSFYNSHCIYDFTPIIKYYARSVLYDNRFVDALRSFWLGGYTINDFFDKLVDEPSWEKGISDDTYNRLACKWLLNNTKEYTKWISKERMTISIGGIFPISQNTRGHQHLVEAVRRAAVAVNENKTILANYNFTVTENDGACKADMVLKSFIHIYFQTEVLGVMGPACSETVEPIAGISRHAKMPVISYSAEGASFVDRKAYPLFFRTIGSNRQFEDVFISLMKTHQWKRVAALTEDGQKYTEYISHMESALKNNNMELIINKKFLNDINPVDMNKVSNLINKT